MFFRYPWARARDSYYLPLGIPTLRSSHATVGALLDLQAVKHPFRPVPRYLMKKCDAERTGRDVFEELNTNEDQGEA